MKISKVLAGFICKFISIMASALGQLVSQLRHGQGGREGRESCPSSSLLCLGPALCVCFSLSLSLFCLSSLFVNVIQCVVSLLKNSPLSYHFWFFLLVQLFLLISACHLFPSSPFDNAIGLPFTIQLTLLCCCSSPSPSAGFYYNASIYFFPFSFFFAAQLQLLFCCFTIC